MTRELAERYANEMMTGTGAVGVWGQQSGPIWSPDVVDRWHAKQAACEHRWDVRAVGGQVWCRKCGSAKDEN